MFREIRKGGDMFRIFTSDGGYKQWRGDTYTQMYTQGEV